MENGECKTGKNVTPLFCSQMKNDHVKNQIETGVGGDKETFVSSSSLHLVQVFPGDLRVTSMVFVKEMSDRTSEIFRETAQNISDAVSWEFSWHVIQVK